jgi:hypothetical protein
LARVPVSEALVFRAEARPGTIACAATMRCNSQLPSSGGIPWARVIRTLDKPAAMRVLSALHFISSLDYVLLATARMAVPRLEQIQTVNKSFS